MGAWIDFSNVVTIGEKTFSNGVINTLGYKDLTAEMAHRICENYKIKFIQINKNLPTGALEGIDAILKVRKDISFRVYGLYNESYFDLDILFEMPHLERLVLDLHLANKPNMVEPDKLCKLSGLKSLTLNLFDLKDYSFIQGLNNDIEELAVMADTMKGTPIFDCKWLLRFQKLNSLWLGKKAKKNLKSIADIASLDKLVLRGIKIDDFYFLQNSRIEELGILWCGINDFSSLMILKDLKRLEIWRISKLDDITAISQLENLEVLKLQDLRHIKELPDLSRLTHLKKLILINVPIDKSSIPNDLKLLISNW